MCGGSGGGKGGGGGVSISNMIDEYESTSRQTLGASSYPDYIAKKAISDAAYDRLIKKVPNMSPKEQSVFMKKYSEINAREARAAKPPKRDLLA